MQEVMERIRERKLTFVSRYLGGGARRGAGIDSAGRSFELTGSDVRRTCENHVERRPCSALESHPDRDGNYRLECIGPEPLDAVCDQRKDRYAEWQPTEDVTDVRCDWTDMMAPTCSIPEHPGASSPPSRSGPTLRCVRSLRDELRYDCQLVSEP